MDRNTGIFGLVANASAVRASYYRERAERLRELAEAEPDSRFRAELIFLVEQFEELDERVAVPAPAE